MRLAHWVAGAALLCGLEACDEPTAPEKQDFELHITSYFEAEHLTVQLDGKRIFSGIATTNVMIGVATIVRLDAEPGRHEIRVLGEGDAVREVFDLTQYEYVLIRRDGVSRELGVRVTTERPLYD